jgi:hypothetical protein
LHQKTKRSQRGEGAYIRRFPLEIATAPAASLFGAAWANMGTCRSVCKLPVHPFLLQRPMALWEMGLPEVVSAVATALSLALPYLATMSS